MNALDLAVGSPDLGAPPIIVYPALVVWDTVEGQALSPRTSDADSGS
jgi:hypothetical protein